MIPTMLAAAMLAGLSVPPTPPPSPSGSCPALEAMQSEGEAETLVQEAAQAMAVRDHAQAEALARRALASESGDVARARALRLLIDLQLPSGDLAPYETILDCDSLQGDAWTHARAWLAYRQGRYADAVRLLQPLARPRHHSLPRWSIVHEDLGDAFARLGRMADAHAQWRIALATDYDPGPTGWDRAALVRKLDQAAAAPEGAPAMLPLQYYDDAASILDATSVRRTDAGVRYSKLVLLQADENGGSYGIDSWEVRCDAPEARVLSVRSFGASGDLVRTVDEPAPWRRDLPGEPWRPTERALVCAMAEGSRLAPRRRSDAELLRAYRAGETLFD
ncbi:hypothetical protein [Sphingosinicella terrae]|uniref:hypothetical protein n=1 Tax=Sphingosinicella terrae TaxID=2172047 RepID=UPI000E0CE920|nr:hypothetical protein [Sphingosinicella terrae]